MHVVTSLSMSPCAPQTVFFVTFSVLIPFLKNPTCRDQQKRFYRSLPLLFTACLLPQCYPQCSYLCFGWCWAHQFGQQAICCRSTNSEQPSRKYFGGRSIIYSVRLQWWVAISFRSTKLHCTDSAGMTKWWLKSFPKDQILALFSNCASRLAFFTRSTFFDIAFLCRCRQRTVLQYYAGCVSDHVNIISVLFWCSSCCTVHLQIRAYSHGTVQCFTKLLSYTLAFYIDPTSCKFLFFVTTGIFRTEERCSSRCRVM